MDLVSGVGSFVMNIFETESDLKKMLEKLDVLIARSQKLLLGANLDEVGDKKQIQLYQNILKRSKEAHATCENSLKGLGIAGRITINLPFSRTKQMLKESVEQLEGMIAQLKELGEPQPVKRKPTEEEKKILASTMTESKDDTFDPTLRQDQQEEMGPTIEDKEDNLKGTWIRVKLTFDAQPSTLKKVQQEMPQIALIDQNFQFKEKKNEKIILSFNRMIFKPYYSTVKGLIPQIDFISSKQKHFEIVCKRQKVDKQVQKTLFTAIKEASSYKKKESQKKSDPKSQGNDGHESDMFFSFPINIPEMKQSEEQYYYSLVCKNYSKIGTFMQRDGSDWQKLADEQTPLQSGDRICPILKRPDRVQAAFSYIIHFEHIKYLD